MSTITCKYHPKVPALWECQQCNIELCTTCVKKDETDASKAICPVCNHYLFSLGMANVIPPFWSRVHTFFIYPASLQAMIFIVVMALVTTVLISIPSPSPFIVIMKVGIPWLIFMRYAYAVLDSTAFGQMRPPPLSLELLTTKMGQPIKQFLVFLAIGFALGYLSQYLHWSIIILIYLFAILCLPATAMILSLENSFFRAVNPLMWVSVITRIGWSYLLLCVFLFLLMIGSGIAVQMFGFREANTYFLLVYFVINMYFTLIMFSMMGYVLYQYHEKFGYSISDEMFDQHMDVGNGKGAPAQSPGLQQASILIQEGKHEEAASLLGNSLKSDYENLDLHDQYHNLLKLMEQKEKLLEHGQRYILLLMEKRKLKRALEIYKECFALDKDFRMPEPGQVYTLAEYAKNTRANNAALALMNGFANHYRGHQDIPKVYFLAAKILCESMHQDEKAKSLLKSIITKYPDHEIVSEIKEYMTLIDQLKGV